MYKKFVFISFIQVFSLLASTIGNSRYQLSWPKSIAPSSHGTWAVTSSSALVDVKHMTSFRLRTSQTFLWHREIRSPCNFNRQLDCPKQDIDLLGSSSTIWDHCIVSSGITKTHTAATSQKPVEYQHDALMMEIQSSYIHEPNPDLCVATDLSLQ